MSLVKRRKVSGSDDTAAMPSVVPSSEASHDHTARVKPKLDKISKLVLVELQKDNPNNVVQALDEIYSMNFDKDDNKLKENLKAVLMIGGPAIVILTMQKPDWQSEEDIQAMSCKCLAQFAFASDCDQCAISQSGGVEAILNALMSFPDSEGVHENGWWALGNIFSTMDEGTTHFQAACRFVEELDGLKLLRKAMERFPENKEIHRDACALLENLSEHKSDRFIKALVKFGVAAVGIALENHSDDEYVKDCAKAFMKKTFADDDDDEDD